MLAPLLIFLLIVLHLNLNKKYQNDATKAVQIVVPLKYLRDFWRILEMPVINSEINLTPTWPANSVISNAAANQATTFAITDTKLCVPVVTLSTDDNAKLLQQS